MSTEIRELVQRLERYNRAYRAGTPEVSDHDYDTLVEKLRVLDPDHAFLGTLEPEAPLTNKKLIRHSRPMRSTEKAYTTEALQKWVERVEKAAAQIGLASVQFRVTPKLDGLAGFDEDGHLATRGNGFEGSDVTEAFARGVVPIGGRNLGVGEIVILKSAFETHFAASFDHPRNMAVGIISSDTLSAQASQALQMGIVHFVPYVGLPNWQGTGTELVAQSGAIGADLKNRVDYALDGFVAEATDSALRDHMGHTEHHYRWQIAIKERGETGQTTVREVVWQTGRTGSVTPVLMVEPIRLSGATIRRITAHHAGMIRDKQVGAGAHIEIIRSGEVIPKLERVLTPARDVALVEVCPSCGSALGWRNDFLVCPNHTGCRAQLVGRIRHWFRILDNADWYGVKTIERLVDGGHDSLEKVYALTESALLALEFGPGQTKNLLEALIISRNQAVQDARFLAAFGILDLGIGDSRKLLSHFSLEALADLDQPTLEAVKGFGAITSHSITGGLQSNWPTIQHMLDLGFNLERTPLKEEQAAIDSPVAGKRILFTGKMELGTRDDMQTGARALGAEVQTSLSGKTDLLVVGLKASAGKRAKAEKLGVQVLSEREYLHLLGRESDG